ncbi:hypothetical protein H8A97_26360 [Bradyrhizobium sp. Arg62]|uniref:hypothetical protein n=1 Tax=Bradyrhizobium brasilense TaxID=1419277 RepID=UPI001E302181|nr:hypothetical protein [Bradyrhizobium brasilense]MCC8948539.1 hypothetical protein [Bradyrhizobium brasilense]
MLDDEFNKQRSKLLRELADKADPFIKRRLLDLASRHEKRHGKTRPLPTVGLRWPDDTHRRDGGETG